jgi:hypothetical protein
MTINRRHMLQSTGAAIAGAAISAGSKSSRAASKSAEFAVRAITKGPKFHWFGYYDKRQFDPESQYVLGMEVDFEHRSPRPDDVIKVGMVDLANEDRWIELGESRSWCWQQGCMLQWMPGRAEEILFNDRQDDRFVCRILNVRSGKRRTIPTAIYALSPDGESAVAADFRRIQDMRPGYGYPGLPDPNRDNLAPVESGVFRVALESGQQELILSLADVAKIPYVGGDLSKAKHYFNHLLVSPSGERFIFLHRWRMAGMRSFGTRMFTAKMDGSDLRVVDHSGHTSHFIWRDPEHILAWTRHSSHGNAFYLFEDKAGGAVDVVGKGAMPVNGHCSYLPGNEWILNDTYPQGKERVQIPYLFHVKSGRRVDLGRFHLPSAYRGEWRCDTHPRFSPDGRSVVIDSPHEGGGRQMHLIDIREIVG